MSEVKVLVNLLQMTGTKGGIESYIRELYSEIGVLNHEFTFVGFASRELFDVGADWFPGELINSKISGENRFLWAIGELFSVAKVARSIRADLVHAPASLGPLRTRMPTVLTIHDLSYFSHPELMKTPLFTGTVKLMERLAARNATRVIAISNATASAVKRYLGVPPERIDRIYSAGRKLETALSSADRDQSRTFLAMGQRSPYKNFEVLPQAWEMIPESLRPQLVITGSHGEDPLLPLVSQRQLAQWISLKGWVSDSDLDRLLRSSSALIETTLAGGFGMPAVEAMSIGLPVISSDVEAFREVLEDGALYYRAGDPASLASVITRVCESRGSLSELSKLGLRQSKKYSWQKTASETLSSFRRALSEHKKT